MTLKLLILLVLLVHYTFTFGQGQNYSIDSLTGCWVNEDGYLKNFLVIKNFKKITISMTNEGNYFIRENPYGFFGLKDQSEKMPTNVSELGKEGNTIISYDDSIKYYDSNGNLKRPLYNSLIIFNEDLEDEKQFKTFSIVGINGRSEIYMKIDSIPDDVLEKLKKNTLDWEKYKRFIKLK